MSRPYRLGLRQASVDRTAQAILAASRRLLATTPSANISVGAIAREAGVSRLTVYQRFGSRAGLFQALVPQRTVDHPPPGDPREGLRRHLLRACEGWASDAALHRHLPTSALSDRDAERRIAEQLLASDALRPGCSLREAEDVIATLASFPVFDGLHRDGRRSPAAVTDILMRLAAGILA